MLTREDALKSFLISHGTGFSEGKERLVAFFEKESDTKVRTAYCKDAFGIGGGGFKPEDNAKDIVHNYNYNFCGIDLEIKYRSDGIENVENYKWSEVVKAIDELIKEGIYIPKEKMNEEPKKALSDTPKGNDKMENKETKTFDNVIIKEGTELTPAVKNAYDYCKNLENSMKESGTYPKIEYTVKDSKEKYTADARMQITSFKTKDGTELAQIRIRDGLQSLTFKVNEQGTAFGAEIKAYSRKNGSFYEPKNPSLNLSNIMEQVKASREKTYDKPYVQKEAFDAFVNFKKYVNENSPLINVEGNIKREFFVSDIEAKPFTNKDGKKVDMYEFDLKGRNQEIVTIRINSRGEFSRAEATRFNGEGASPTYTTIDSAEALATINDKGLANILNEAMTVLPEKEEQTKETTSIEGIDAEIEVEDDFER